MEVYIVGRGGDEAKRTSAGETTAAGDFNKLVPGENADPSSRGRSCRHTASHGHWRICRPKVADAGATQAKARCEAPPRPPQYQAARAANGRRRLGNNHHCIDTLPHCPLPQLKGRRRQR